MMHDIEIYEEKREELIYDEVKHLISSIGEFYPFTPSHINEALMELKDDQLLNIVDKCEKASHDDSSMAILGREIWCDIYEYWGNLATEQAERETPSAGELRFEAMQERADHRREMARDREMGL